MGNSYLTPAELDKDDDLIFAEKMAMRMDAMLDEIRELNLTDGDDE